MSTTVTVNSSTDLKNAITTIDTGAGQNKNFVLNIGPLDISAANNPYANIGGLSGSGNVALGAITLTLSDNGYDAYSGVISGSGSVGESGSGTLVLTGQSTSTGSLVINSGIVQLGNGGTTGFVASSIVDDAVLAIDHGGISSIGNLITGYGSVNLNGSGTTIFTTNELYSGLTTVETGSLQLGNGGTTGMVSGAVKVASASDNLIFDRSDNVGLGTTITGYGNLEQIGTGTLDLQAYTDFTGATLIQSGTLAIQGNGTLQSSSGVTLAAGAVFDISASGQYYNGINALNGAAGSIVSLGGNVLTLHDSGNDAFAGAITGNGGELDISGTGSITLTGQNSYTGRTVVNSGILQLGNGGNAPGAVGDIVNDATLVLDYTGTYDGTISGSGSVVQAGGTLDIGTKETFGGQTTIAGTLRFDDGGSFSGPVSIMQGGILAFNHSDYLAYGGYISGAGSVVQAGSGILELSGSNAFSGGISIGSGTLELDDGAAAGSGAIAFTNGLAGTLRMHTDMPTGPITNFAVGDTIDVRAIGLASNVTVTSTGFYVSGISGALSLNVADATSYANDRFVLTADGSGGTNITIDPASVPQTLALAAAGNYVVAPSTDGTSLDIYPTGSATPVVVADTTQLNFADGTGLADPTGQIGDVARLYQAAFGRTPDMAGLDYWADQATTDHVSLATISASFAASPEFVADYANDSSTQFVQALYQNVLGRGADSSGLSYWTSVLDSGSMNESGVLNAFAQSQENISGTSDMAGSANDAEVYRLYHAAFGRAPDAAGSSFWTSALSSGATSLEMAQSFVATPEFQSDFTGLDNAGFVNQLYVHVFGAAGDSTGIQYWTAAMNGGMTQAQVLLDFADSPQNLSATAGATHAGWVFIKS